MIKKHYIGEPIGDFLKVDPAMVVAADLYTTHLKRDISSLHLSAEQLAANPLIANDPSRTSDELITSGKGKMCLPPTTGLNDCWDFSEGKLVSMRMDICGTYADIRDDMTAKLKTAPIETTRKNHQNVFGARWDDLDAVWDTTATPSLHVRVMASNDPSQPQCHTVWVDLKDNLVARPKRNSFD
jgi:hypothetical protein